MKFSAQEKIQEEDSGNSKKDKEEKRLFTSVDIKTGIFWGIFTWGFIIISGISIPIGNNTIIFASFWLILAILIQMVWNYFNKKKGTNFWDNWRAQKSNQYLLIGGFFLYLGIIIGKLIIYRLNYGWSKSRFSSTAIWLSFFVVIFSSITEELFFSKTMIQLLSSTTSSKIIAPITILIESLCWVAIHFQYYSSWLNLLFIFILGLYFGILYLYTRKIWYCIAFHAINNIISLVVLLFIPI